MIMCKRGHSTILPLSLSFFPSAPHSYIAVRSLSLLCAHLTLANVAYEQFRCVRISTSSASGECDTTGHSIYAKYKYTYIFMFDCMCVCVCVCISMLADPSSRQQLNLSVVRKCGSVVCCQTNGEREQTKKAKQEGNSKSILAWRCYDTLARYFKHLNVINICYMYITFHAERAIREYLSLSLSFTIQIFLDLSTLPAH